MREEMNEIDEFDLQQFEQYRDLEREVEELRQELTTLKNRTAEFESENEKLSAACKWTGLIKKIQNNLVNLSTGELGAVDEIVGFFAEKLLSDLHTPQFRELAERLINRQ